LTYNTVWALCGYIPVPKAIVSFDSGGIAIAICFHKSRYYRLQHIEKMQNMDGQDREMMYGEVFGIGKMFVSVHSTQKVYLQNNRQKIESNSISIGSWKGGISHLLLKPLS
jgi:hypothetical protein